MAIIESINLTIQHLTSHVYIPTHDNVVSPLPLLKLFIYFLFRLIKEILHFKLMKEKYFPTVFLFHPFLVRLACRENESLCVEAKSVGEYWRCIPHGWKCALEITFEIEGNRQQRGELDGVGSFNESFWCEVFKKFSWKAFQKESL